MQIEEDTHDDFHRTDLEGGEGAEEPAAAEAEAEAPADGAMMEGDDDYQADELVDISDDEDKQIIMNAQFDNDTVKNKKYYNWDYPFERAKPGSAHIGMWCVGSFLGGMGGLCILFGTDDKDTLENKYTQYHLKVNTGFFFTFAASIFFGWFMATLYAMGKFENKTLRMIVEPFLMLFRLAATCAFAYFVLYKFWIQDFLVGCFFACTKNWWAKKTDPWVTNASYFNAIINWPVFFLGCIMMLQIVFGILTLLMSLFTRTRNLMRALAGLPKTFWLFLRGLDSKQYEFNLDQKCPVCKEGFTLDSKIGIMGQCSCWYHRKCLSQKMKDNGPSFKCDGCGKMPYVYEEPKYDDAEAEGPEGACAKEAEGPEGACAEAEGPEGAQAEAEGPEGAAQEEPAAAAE